MAEKSVLTAVFQGHLCELRIHRRGIAIQQARRSPLRRHRFIPLRNIIAVTSDDGRRVELAIAWPQQGCMCFRPGIERILLDLSHIERARRQEWSDLVRSKANLPHSQTNTCRYLLIYNPNSGKKRSRALVEHVVAPMLEAAGVQFDVVPTQRQSHATELAAQLDIHRYTRIIAAGGDGLVNEIINGNWSGHRVPICVLPTGSDNSISASLGMWTLFDAVLAIIKGHLVKIDLASLSYASAAGDVGGESELLFSCVCGVGALGTTIEKLEAARWMGPIRTWVVSLKMLFQPVRRLTTPIKVEWRLIDPKLPVMAGQSGDVTVLEREGDGVWATLEGELISAAVGTGPGKNMAARNAKLFPHGDFTDGVMDMFVLRRCSSWQMISTSLRLALDGHSHLTAHPQVTSYAKASEVRITLPADRPINVDGEVVRLGREQTLRINVLPQALSIIGPADYHPAALTTVWQGEGGDPGDEHSPLVA